MRVQRLAGHPEVTCGGPGHTGRPRHEDADVQDDGVRGFAPPSAAGKGQPPLGSGTWTHHLPPALLAGRSAQPCIIS